MRRRFTGPFSIRAARRAAAVSLGFQWFIIATGATVRLTGSGLGCPNWPTCTKARVVPELSFHPLVEFLNRMTSTPTLVAALVALWLCWRVEGGPRRDLRWATVLVLVGIFLQAFVGALVVIFELPPELVSTHFLISVFLLTAATFAWVATADPRPLHFARERARRSVRLVGAIMLASLLVVIFVGVLTTASGPHAGASGTGQEVDRLGIFSLAVTLHARGAYVFAGMLAVLTWVRRRTGRGPALRDLVAVLVLVAVQIALGEVQYRSGLPWEVVLAHVLNAALLWIVASRVTIDAVFSRHGSDHRTDRDRPAAAGSRARR